MVDSLSSSTTARQWPARTGDERGSLSLFAVVIAVALLIVVGLVVDGGGKIAALQRADGAAREAARAAGQAIDVPAAVHGERPAVDAQAAAQAARDYLVAARVQGSVSVSGTVITVTTQADYRPVFLSLIGLGDQSVTGRAEARPARAVDGAER